MMWFPRTLYLIVVFLCSVQTMARADDAKDSGGNIVDSLKAAYDDLPPRGKLAVGAVAGFATSRVAVKTAVGAVKLAGAAFIVTEVASLTGVLNHVNLGEENKLHINQARNTVTNVVNGFRDQVKRRLNPESVHNTIASAMGKEKMATLGAAAGAFVGFLI